jgi:hypothetical protein
MRSSARGTRENRERFLLTHPVNAICDRATLLQLCDAVANQGQRARAEHGGNNVIVDFTSAETTTVVNWIESDEQRRHYWLALAANALVRNERTAAIPKISAALYEAVVETLPTVDGLAGDLIPRLLLRVNFYEIAAALLTEAAAPSQQAAA